jgi:hypothetical protein
MAKWHQLCTTCQARQRRHLERGLAVAQRVRKHAVRDRQARLPRAQYAAIAQHERPQHKVLLPRPIGHVDGAAGDGARARVQPRRGVQALEHVPVGLAENAEEEGVLRARGDVLLAESRGRSRPTRERRAAAADAADEADASLAVDLRTPQRCAARVESAKQCTNACRACARPAGGHCIVKHLGVLQTASISLLFAWERGAPRRAQRWQESS